MPWDEIGRRLLDLAPRQTVDDTGVAGMLVAQEGHELLTRVGLLDDAIADVRSVEAGDELSGLLQTQAGQDLGAGRGIGGRGEGDARDLRPALVQLMELDVLGAEIMAPLGDAMGLVDREQGHPDAIEQRMKRSVSRRSGAT
jgi:hypothetical protein